MKNQRKHRESKSGYHFINLYQNCPRKFFLRYLKRLVPRLTASPLLFGYAFHEGKALFYNTKSPKKAIKKVKDILLENHDHYEIPGIRERDLLQCPILLEAWINDLGRNDLKNYKIHAVEKALSLPIPYTNTFRMTMRLDAILGLRGNAYIMETKTSRFSKKTSEDGVRFGDQATAYIWGAKQAFPHLNIVGVLPDIAYWNSSAKYQANIDCFRGAIVYRSVAQLREFEKGIATLVTEIAQRVEAYSHGTNESFLFPRNTQWCTSYNKPCEYVSLCRLPHLTEEGRAPRGFRRERKTSTYIGTEKVSPKLRRKR